MIKFAISAYFAAIALGIALNVHGIVLCFKASVVLGVLSLFVQGSGAVESLVYWGGYDIAAHLAQALGLA